MSDIINIYCDESCHLEHDRQKAMVLGAVWCPCESAGDISKRIREIKQSHGLGRSFEIKWTKVSPAKSQFYLDLVDFFLDDDDLHFRALIIPDKSLINHEMHSQTHDDWYYKMYFDLLKVIIDPKLRYQIYIDIKDTRGAEKISHLHDVLCNANYDFSRKIIQRIQTVRSHEVNILQLADLLIGAVSYANRSLSGNAGKEAIIARLRERTHYSLIRTTLLRENKMNLFCWHANPGKPE
jgi:hypothetical protein